MTAYRGALLVAASLFASTGAGADELASTDSRHVVFDQSTLIQLDHAAKTVIVGNPAIADAQLVNGKTIYVLGRMFGQTNLIAIDADGNEVLNTVITVGAPSEDMVTLYRGAQGQRTLACSPHCQRTLTQGDAEFQVMTQDAEKKIGISESSGKLSSPR